jgi:hypothetical protein
MHFFTRTVIVLSAFAFAPGCNKVDFEPIPDAELNQDKKTTAESLGQRILGEWAKDEYKELGAEANEEFRKAHNSVDGQRTSDKAIEKSLGSFQSMTFSQALRTKDKKAEVYRFKGVFDKTTDPVEVRVVLDPAGKLSGLWIKPWKDGL